jgi:hypothetical protein
MQSLVRFTTDEGDPIPKADQVWCLVTPYAEGPQAFCTGEYFGYGEGGNSDFETKSAKGGVTCEKCRDQIKLIKAVRL